MNPLYIVLLGRARTWNRDCGLLPLNSAAVLTMCYSSSGHVRRLSSTFVTPSPFTGFTRHRSMPKLGT